MFTSTQKVKGLLLVATTVTAAVLALTPGKLFAAEPKVTAEMVYLGPARVTASGQEPSDDLEIQVRFTNGDTRAIQSLKATVNVMENRAVVGRFDIQAGAIEAGKSITVTTHRSVGSSLTVEGRVVGSPDQFASQAFVESVKWGQEMEPEEAARQQRRRGN